MHTVALQADCHKIVIILLQNHLSVSGLKVYGEKVGLKYMMRAFIKSLIRQCHVLANAELSNQSTRQAAKSLRSLPS